MITSGGWKMMEKSKKYFLGNKIWVEKQVFFLTVNQLKKTSDCIKIDPPGPGRNLKKSQKNIEKGDPKFW